VARPIPDEAPVTIARFPVSSTIRDFTCVTPCLTSSFTFREPELVERRGPSMLLLVLLALLAIVAFGIGFTIHWLFIVAIVLALIWVIAMFTGGFGRSGARRW
jgi:hypothetical protein